jgi:hypothetical protein
MEFWKNIIGNEDYQVSNLGNVKSLKSSKERVLKGGINSRGYHCVGLCKDGIQKIRTTHQLVAIHFLNHIPSGLRLVVDHIDGNKRNNTLDNLQILTNRENCSKDKINKVKSIKHIGVNWSKRDCKWRARIYINGKDKHLGFYEKEIDASNAYKKALNNLIN